MKKFQMFAVVAIMSFVFVSWAQAGHGTSPEGKEIPIEKAAVKLVADAKGSGFNLIATDDLKKWYDEGKTLPSSVHSPLMKTSSLALFRAH